MISDGRAMRRGNRRRKLEVRTSVGDAMTALSRLSAILERSMTARTERAATRCQPAFLCQRKAGRQVGSHLLDVVRWDEADRAVFGGATIGRLGPSLPPSEGQNVAKASAREVSGAELACQELQMPARELFELTG